MKLIETQERGNRCECGKMVELKTFVEIKEGDAKPLENGGHVHMGICDSLEHDIIVFLLPCRADAMSRARVIDL